jgi:hypothetical protein
MGLLKKIAGGAIAGVGVLTGQPGLVISGGSMVAGDFAKGTTKGKKKPQVAISEGRQTVIPGATPPPKVAHSLGERRAMNRERMGRVYGYGPGI